MVTPCSRRRPMAAKISRTRSGARPSDGSSRSMTRGRAMSPRATASICCWPPDSATAGRWSFSTRPGKRASAVSRSARTAGASRPLARARAPSTRLSCTLWSPKMPRPSGARAMPCRATHHEGRPPISRPSKVIRPEAGRRTPAMVLRSVVLPAPLLPITETISPGRTSMVTSCSTSTAP